MSLYYALTRFLKHRSFRFLFFCLISFAILNLALFLSAGKVYSGQATLSWNAPTTNADGTPLTDLAGYKVYYGTASGIYSQNKDVGNVTTYTVVNLTDGLTYYFAVTAYDTSMNESEYSNEVSKTIQSIQQYTLTLNKSGTGSGTVTSSPAGINCGSDCSEAYGAGTVVTLTASPDASSTFGGWSGSGCSGTGTCMLTMDAAKSVTATFTIKTYTITATSGAGGSISPSGTVSVNYGANQAFTITANTGYSVANVLVDGTSFGAVSTYTFSNVIANHTISASFAINTYSLSITKTGSGTGTVTSSPAGINCGSDCGESYNAGTVVTLTASPDASSTFGGWSGSGCSGTGTCTLTMNAVKAVTASFTEDIYPDISVTPSSHDFGKVGIGSDPVKYIFVVTNIGTANLIINTNKITGLDASEFSLFDDNCSGRTLIPSDKCTVSVVFSPVSVGSKNANLNIPSNDPSTPIVNIQLSGSGFAESTSSIDLPKTGQTISYASWDDGYIQAGIEWPSPRFMDNGDGTVTDNLTGLMWLKDGDCLINSNWDYALNEIEDFNNNPGSYNCLNYAANYSDWRLPNVKELESLINYGDLDSAARLNSEGFVDVKSSYYWSSTTYPSNTSQAWVINIYDGTEKFYAKRYRSYILPVRTWNSDNPYDLPKTGQTISYATGDDGYIQAGSDWPSPRFTDNSDGTVTDNLTGLMWLKDRGCLINSNWDYALNEIEDFNNNPGSYNCLNYAANYSDWRLPNVKELESLINYGDLDSAARLNSEGFVDVKSSYYWSSTTYPKNTSQAWVINMSKGDMIPAKKNYNYYISPVRSGNVVELPPPGITVTVPSGGETWSAGTTQTIRWTYTGSPDMYVKIELYKGGVLNQTITSNAWIGGSGSGYYNWKIPSVQGSDYTIKVTSTNSSYSDMSDDTFTIQGPPPPEITVTRPVGVESLVAGSTTGGEIWVAGNTERISWTYKGNLGSYVVIELLQGDKVVKTLTSRARTTTGYYDWRIPSTQTPGTDYRIRVKSKSYSNIYSTSDYFTIESQ